MNIKSYLLFLLVFASGQFFAQDYSRLKVNVANGELKLLSDLGVAVDHGLFREDKYFISDFSSAEKAIMDQQGVAYEILIADIELYYETILNQDIKPQANLEKNSNCPNASNSVPWANPATPTHFNLGTMGGYLKYEELLSELDEMASVYPNLITVKAPFETSMMVHFWKRLNLEIVSRINERVVRPAKALGQKEIEEEKDKKEEKIDKNSEEKEEKLEEQKVEKEEKETEPANQGKLLLDATVALADIRYPTDIKLLNEAREQTEIVIDALYPQVKEQLPKKPRTYRREARTAYLQIAKQRQPNSKKIRKAMRQQLGYVRRNLAHIDTLIAAGAKLSELKKNLYRNLLVVSEVYRQQQLMYEQGCHRIDDRIVSIPQPHVRPIVRGKSGTPVEFGAKLSVSCVDGHTFLDHLSWDNFNESGE